MKNPILRKLLLYIYNNFLGNFLGFVVGMASTKLVSNFFATKSIKNLWGLTTKKTIVDKQTFTVLEWSISILIGFVVFEIISKAVKKKFDELLPTIGLKARLYLQTLAIGSEKYPMQDTATASNRPREMRRDVQ